MEGGDQAWQKSTLTVNGINNKHFLTAALHSAAACFALKCYFQNKSAAILYSRIIPTL